MPKYGLKGYWLVRCQGPTGGTTTNGGKWGTLRSQRGTGRKKELTLHWEEVCGRSGCYNTWTLFRQVVGVWGILTVRGDGQEEMVTTSRPGGDGGVHAASYGCFKRRWQRPQRHDGPRLYESDSGGWLHLSGLKPRRQIKHMEKNGRR